MANICGNAGLLCAARFTELDGSGFVVSGALRGAVVQPVDAVVTWEYEDGITLTQRNGCGDVCFRYKTDAQLVGGTLRVTLCDLNPALEELLDGGNIITSGANDIGYFGRAMDVNPPHGVAVELFDILRDGKQKHPTFDYVRFGYPWVKNWRRCDITHDSSPLLPTWTGDLEANVNYQNGAFNDWPEEFADEVLYGWHYTNTLPVPGCDLVTIPAQTGS
jgi:hypothetical protein